MRRVLSDYFNYDVLYVMNITDIDDKIIKRARQNYLYETYINENHSLEEVLTDTKEVMTTFENTVEATTDPDKKQMYESMRVKIKESIGKLEDTMKKVNGEISESQKVLFIFK